MAEKAVPYTESCLVVKVGKCCSEVISANECTKLSNFVLAMKYDVI